MITHDLAFFIFGAILLLIGLLGKIKAKDIELGTDNRLIKFSAIILGLIFISPSLYLYFIDLDSHTNQPMNDSIEIIPSSPGKKPLNDNQGFDPSKLLISGRWKALYSTDDGMTETNESIEINYKNDGTYNGIRKTNYKFHMFGGTSNQPTGNKIISGKWSVTSQGKNRFTLSDSRGNDFEHRSTRVYKIINENKFIDEDLNVEWIKMK